MESFFGTPVVTSEENCRVPTLTLEIVRPNVITTGILSWTTRVPR